MIEPETVVARAADHRVEDSLGEKAVTMVAGDAISIEKGTWHHARNVGEQEAIFVIAFSSADRQTVTA